MKNLKIKSVLALLAIFMFNACSEDFLDLKPLDVEVTTNFYTTEEEAFQALVAIYDVLTYQDTPFIHWMPFVTVSDVLSDDAFAGGSDPNDGFEWDQLNNYRTRPVSPIAHAIWIKNYIGVFRANLFLEVIDDIDASESFKRRTIAEAKFLRAYFYLEQVRFFENIPLLLETIKGPSEYTQEQNTPQEVYNQIALDLVEAIADLPETVPPNEAGRITKWAAQALLARTYLFYNGVYGGNLTAGSTEVDRTFVLEQLRELIEESGHDLFEDYSHNFSLVGEFGIESVFEISYGDSPPWGDWDYIRGGNGNLAAQMQGPRVVAGSQNWNRGWSFAPVSHKLYEFMQDDPRRPYTILLEEELDGTLVKGYQHTGYFSRKYTSDAEHWGTDGSPELNRTVNHRVIRFSDVLLMAAELDSPNKQEYLNRVRARVGLDPVDATLDNILRERRLELSLEGIRYYDVLRRGLAYATQEFTYSGIMGPNYESPDQVIYDATFNAATRGFLPIPQSEIDLSGGVFKQNDGY
ncbi:MAG: RagB/SusD family nutrient uptake outer membrane protein [Bacteroidetes bacterium]|nr:MAG: RagB/SusD family nutrient uptake outer membrane protein [Bacteroidota bacterium]